MWIQFADREARSGRPAKYTATASGTLVPELDDRRS
uniref:Uncharacterized protein n=2 Tax=Musa acuminata subsp. malaccensis TaxID=214687 RepID=A0A804KM79_MUSAM